MSVPTTWPREEASASNPARQLATAASRPLARPTHQGSNSLGWLPLSEHRPRELVVAALQLLAKVLRYPRDLLRRLRQVERSLHGGQAQDKTDHLRLPQSRRRDPRQFHRAEALRLHETGAATPHRRRACRP